MKLSVGIVNGTKVVPLSEVEKLVEELNAYKIANKNLQTMLDIALSAKGEKSVSKDAG